MNEYNYQTITEWRGVKLQEKFAIDNGIRTVVSYRIVKGDTISKSYFSRGRAVKAFVDAYADNKIRVK